MHNVIRDCDEQFTCNQDGCMRTFTRYSSYRKHLLGVHPQCNEGAHGHTSMSGTEDNDVAEDNYVDHADCDYAYLTQLKLKV